MEEAKHVRYRQIRLCDMGEIELSDLLELIIELDSSVSLMQKFRDGKISVKCIVGDRVEDIKKVLYTAFPEDTDTGYISVSATYYLTHNKKNWSSTNYNSLPFVSLSKLLAEVEYAEPLIQRLIEGKIVLRHDHSKTEDLRRLFGIIFPNSGKPHGNKDFYTSDCNNNWRAIEPNLINSRKVFNLKEFMDELNSRPKESKYSANKIISPESIGNDNLLPAAYIEGLKKGENAIVYNNEGVDLLKRVLSIAFPNAMPIHMVGGHKYYYVNPYKTENWVATNNEVGFNCIPISKFLEEINNSSTYILNKVEYRDTVNKIIAPYSVSEDNLLPIEANKIMSETDLLDLWFKPIPKERSFFVHTSDGAIRVFISDKGIYSDRHDVWFSYKQLKILVMSLGSEVEYFHDKSNKKYSYPVKVDTINIGCVEGILVADIKYIIDIYESEFNC